MTGAALQQRTQPSFVVDSVVFQHAEEAIQLWNTRRSLTSAPHVTLRHLRSADERLEAHLDGLAVAGERAWTFCEAALDPPTSGALFVAALRAIDAKDSARVERLVTLAKEEPTLIEGLVSALGWLDAEQLPRLAGALLASREPISRTLGLGACSVHRVDPGQLDRSLEADTPPPARARALRLVGELGLTQFLAVCTAAVDDEDPDSRFWGAWSAVLLGDRSRAMHALRAMATVPSPDRERAMRLVFQAVEPEVAQATLRQLAQDPTHLRWVIEGAGLAGDPMYVPWLIKQMAEESVARIAAEALATITGLDLFQGFEMQRPEGAEAGATDEPADENVEMDADEGLPWPDVEKIRRWWASNAGRFQPGVRYFSGAPLSRAHCIEVLKSGYQRQRILAAHYLCLLEPGMPLFNTSAPARRQELLLAEIA